MTSSAIDPVTAARLSACGAWQRMLRLPMPSSLIRQVSMEPSLRPSTYDDMASEPSSASPATIGQLLAGMALFGSSTPLSKIIGDHFAVFTASCLRMVDRQPRAGPLRVVSD